MTVDRSVVVVGGGFQGLLAYQILGEAGCAVTLIERTELLGGVLASVEEEGLFLDNGCHVFENSDSETTRLVRGVLGPDILPVEVRYASITEGRKVDGVSIPDFTGTDRARRDRMVIETISAVAAPEAEASTLADLLHREYGPVLAEALGKVVEKAARVGPEDLDPGAFFTLPLHRVRLLPDEASLLLKRLPELDARLAVPSQSKPMRFYPEAEAAFPHRIFYPRGKGMRTFCERSEAYLGSRGVNLMRGRSVEALSREAGGVVLRLDDDSDIQADRMVWTLEPHRLAGLAGDTDDLGNLTHRVPMVLYYFLVPANEEPDYTYIQDFSEDSLVYRASSPGFYGRQRNGDGLSCLLAEIPTEQDSILWREPEAAIGRVWQEMRALGMSARAEPIRTIVRRTPVSYRLHRPGYAMAAEAARRRVMADWPEILPVDGVSFSKVDIAENLRKELELFFE